ncbi:unnamed protein product [Symbiodinium sp. CCMP2456]|nr:unnamed protein product [Symbiodinium sp. CCMP2456]
MLHQKDCHELLDSIAQVGFVTSRVEAIGVEVCSEAEREYNVQLCSAAVGKLGSMDPAALKILSLSASHTTFALRLVASAAPHESDSLSVNGILSLEQVRLRDPVLAQHVEHGLTWQVIAKEVALAHPELLQLVQSSQNATLVKSESELQLLRRVFSLCSRPNPPDFQGVKKMALSSKPPCGETFPALYTFELFGVLRQASLMSTMVLPPLSVGVHPQNRDGIMLHQKDCHELLDSIAQVGFVASRVEAIGVEVCSEAEREYNVQLCSAAAGKLGSMDPAALKILSLSASHTNFALRLVASAAPHESDSLSVNGILSLEQVRSRDPVLAQHVEHGLTWQVIAKEVALAHPELLQLVQSSQNATLVKSESELQLLRRVFSLCSRPNPPDFQGVKKMALSSKPPCGETFPALYTFALRYCGGSDGRFLRETEQFVRSQGHTRSLGLGFWQLLAQDFMKGQQQVAHMRHAILKVGLSGTGLTQTNAKKMFSKDCSPKILEGDKVLRELRELVSSAGIDILHDVRFINILGIVDMTVARFCLGLQAEDGKEYKSIQGIAHDATLLFATLGVQLTSPWQTSAEATTGAQSSKSQAFERMRELNSDGSLRNASELLADKGFTLQAFVRRRADKLECRIDGIQGQQIHLVELGKKGIMKVPIEQFLAGTWAIFQPRSEPEIIEDLSVFMPSECHDFQAAVVVACIQKELATLTEDHKDVMLQLSLQLKPTKALVTKKNFSKGQLVLIPSSYKVVQRPKSQGDLSNAVKVQVDWQADDRQFWITACNSMPKADEAFEPGKHCLAPFFLVPASEEVGAINLVMFMAGSKESKVKIPILKNTHAVAKGTSLLQAPIKKDNKREQLEMPVPVKRVKGKQ